MHCRSRDVCRSSSIGCCHNNRFHLKTLVDSPSLIDSMFEKYLVESGAVRNPPCTPSFSLLMRIWPESMISKHRSWTFCSSSCIAFLSSSESWFSLSCWSPLILDLNLVISSETCGEQIKSDVNMMPFNDLFEITRKCYIVRGCDISYTNGCPVTQSVNLLTDEEIGQVTLKQIM